MVKKVVKIIFAHKIIALLAMVVVLGSFYFGFKALTGAKTETSYVTTPVEKGSVMVLVSGTGQVSASNQVEIKSEVSSDVTYVGVVQGQEVKEGTVLFRFDAKDAQKSVRDAQASLNSAKISLAKTKQPAEELTILQAENSLASAQEAKTQAQEDLKKSYEDALNDITEAFLDLPTIMAGLQDTLYSNTISNSLTGGWQWNIDYYTDTVKNYDDKVLQYKELTDLTYQTARTEYDKNFADYKSASRFSDNETIEALLAKTYETTKDISEAIKNANNLIQFYKDTLSQRNLRPNAAADTHLATLSDYTSQANSHLTSLLAVKTSIKNNQEAIIDSDRTIAEKTASLADLKAGTDPLDIQSQEISVKQKENSLLDAYEKLADYSVKAPFAGVIASVEIEKGDSVTSATALATLITKQQIAEISLNEVDVAKVKIGQKATITFDAVTDLTITGQVVEIDEIGTVSQGVVSYNVKIAFDVQDQRVKPGMSLSVSIVTDSKQDVLVVPIGAVKTLGTESYVQILTNNQPERKTVVVGISSDTMSEIVSGLSEGDEVITQTITGAASSSATNISSNKSNSNAMRGIMQLEGGAGGPGR